MLYALCLCMFSCVYLCFIFPNGGLHSTNNKYVHTYVHKAFDLYLYYLYSKYYNDCATFINLSNLSTAVQLTQPIVDGKCHGCSNRVNVLL